jgi:outer membrane protein, heavy metal efflux system
LLVICWMVSISCATSTRDHAWLEREVYERVGAGTSADEANALSPQAYLANGLDEAEVVLMTLSRNPTLRVELTRMDAARAALEEASTVANPQLSVMGPIGPVSAVATLLAPIESLWQMPQRTEAAAKDVDATAEAVLMRALDLVRDVCLLHVELGVASDRVVIRRELEAISAEFARIASVRARLGEISPMDERLFSADASVAADASLLAETEVALAQARLAAQLALDEDSTRALYATFLNDDIEMPALADLKKIARAARPDARSAEFAISAAMARAGWEERRVISVGLLVEGQWTQANEPALRLGARIELPIFGNPGVGRAEAEVMRATAQNEVVAHTIVMEVTTARARALQAMRSQRQLEERVLPALGEALSVAKSSFEAGDDTYLTVLEMLRRNGDARLQHADLVAARRRAQCELNRAMGARLDVAYAVSAREDAERGAP